MYQQKITYDITLGSAIHCRSVVCEKNPFLIHTFLQSVKNQPDWSLVCEKSSSQCLFSAYKRK